MNDSASRPVRVRFAPSPTGTLHIGSARTALYNYLFARHGGGSLILRIEDTDIARSEREHEESIIADLAWLGLKWDEGPDTGGAFGPYRQSERLKAGIYHESARCLLQSGRAYHCFCSQERLEELKQENLARGEMPRYDRCCAAISREEAEARMAAGQVATIRFRVPDHPVVVEDAIHGRIDFSHEVLGDFIIIRSDGGVSYNFAVVVDDAAMEITHVIRGEDHLTNTARQLLVFEALDARPPFYAHHSLIMGPDGGKLSKRHGATAVGDFRRMGYKPEAIINYLALLSWSPGEEREKLTLAEMESEFDLSRVAKSPAIFDVAKLNWLNGLYIRDLSPVELTAELKPFTGEVTAELNPGQLAVAEAAVQTQLVTLADAPGQIEELSTMAPLAGTEELAEISDEHAAAVMELVAARAGELPTAADLDPENPDAAVTTAREWINSLKKECKDREIPPKRLFRTLRIALTGRSSGPELPYLLAALGRDEVLGRLNAARELVSG